MDVKKLSILFLVLVMLGTTSVSFATSESTWNNITFTVPDGYNTGTPGADKIAMVNGGDRILLANFDEDGLNELKEESELSGNETYIINDLNITELKFDQESGTKYLFLFSKDGNDYQISYFEPAPVEDEEDEDEADEADSESDEDTDDNDTDANDTEDSSEDSEDDDKEEETFDINSADNPVNVIINSLKFN